MFLPPYIIEILIKQTHAASCYHNHMDFPVYTNFALSIYFSFLIELTFHMAYA